MINRRRGKHRRTSNIIAAIKIVLILVAVVFWIMGGTWILLDMH